VLCNWQERSVLIEKIRLLFEDEYLFEWEIPERYVVHVLSLPTLHDRGFRMEPYGISNRQGKLIKPQTTSDLRKRIHEVHNFRQYLAHPPCFECAVHICVDGRDLRLNQKLDMEKGYWNPWMPKILDRDCGQSYS
jgi:hypothetical protein